jgi:hypothetical protein
VTPKFRASMNIIIDNELTIEEIERLQETMAVILGCVGLEGRIYCKETTKIIDLTDPSITANAELVKTMYQNMAARAIKKYMAKC